MASEHLFKESERMRAEIASLKAAGLAPEDCWLSPWDKKTKKGKTRYYRINERLADGSTKTTYLGREGCNAHESWEAKIDRRNQCSELEQQLAMLNELIARQGKAEQERAIALGKQQKARAEALGQDSPVSEDMGSMYQPGDRFVWESHCYEVVKAGLKHMRLLDCEGKHCNFHGKEGAIVYPGQRAAA